MDSNAQRPWRIKSRLKGLCNSCKIHQCLQCWSLCVLTHLGSDDDSFLPSSRKDCFCVSCFTPTNRGVTPCLLQCMLQSTFAVASITEYRCIQASFHWLNLHLWVLNVLDFWVASCACRKKMCKSLMNSSDKFGLVNSTLHRKPAAAAGIGLDF